MDNGIVAQEVPAREADWRQGITLAFAGFLPILSVLSLAPAIPTIIAHFKDVPNAAFLVPVMATTPGLMVALLSPFAGWVTDRFGRRNPMVWATFFYALSGIAPFFLDDLTAIFLSRLVVGVAEAFVLTIVNTLLSDYFPENKRRNWITVQGVLGAGLGAVSLAASGWLSSIQWNGMFLIYGTAFFIFIAMYAWFYEPQVVRTGDRTVHEKTPFPWPMVAAYCGVTLFSSVIFYVFLVNGGLAFQAIGVTSPAHLGLVMGLVSLGNPVGALLFNLSTRRWPIERVIVLVILLVGGGTAGVGFARSETVMAVAALIEQVGAGMIVTALIFWVSRLLAPEHRGRGFGAWTSAFFIGQFMSPAIVGIIAARTGNILNAFAMLGLAGVAFAVLIFAIRHRLPQPQRN